MDDHGECAIPQPSDEHSRLMEDCGTWNVACNYHVMPEGAPTEATATETVEALGAFWTVSHFQSEMAGMPFSGRCTMGFDPNRGKYVSTWIDTMSTHLFVMEGEMDGDGVLRMSCQGPCPTGQGMADYEMKYQRLDDGKRQFDMYIGSADAEMMNIFTYVYSRAE